MIQQQTFGTTLLQTPAKIVAEAGIMGMARGLVMSCGREGVFTAGMLGFGPALRRYASEKLGYSDAASSAISAVGAGVVVGTLSHPMDTIKTCQQGDVLGKTYGGVIGTTRTLLSQGSAARFFSGWSFRTGRMVLQVFMFDKAKTVLSPIMFPHHFK